MKEEIFLNKRVSEIMELSGRQVLSWTEKGLIVPAKESPGVGIKRLYDKVNLLEFGLAKILLEMGLGFRTTKKIIGELRRWGKLKSWANNFSDYYKDQFEKTKAEFRKHISELEKEDPSKAASLEDIYDQIREPFKQEKPTGILLYYFGNDEHVFVFPWDAEYTLNLYIIKENLIGNQGFILVDLGKIKATIERRI